MCAGGPLNFDFRNTFANHSSNLRRFAQVACMFVVNRCKLLKLLKLRLKRVKQTLIFGYNNAPKKNPNVNQPIDLLLVNICYISAVGFY